MSSILTIGSSLKQSETAPKASTTAIIGSYGIMREFGLRDAKKGRFRVVTIDSHHDLPIAPNHLAQTPPPTGPNQKWVQSR